MVHAAPGTPPLIAWSGQLFVPLRRLTGEVESALLLLNLVWDALTLSLVYLVVRKLGARALDSLAAVVACGSSGIFIAMNHQFFTETTQMVSCAIMVFAVTQIERRSLVGAASLIVIGCCIGMLSKSSSIIFIFPLVGYAAVVLIATKDRPRPRATRADIALASAALGLALAAGSWYFENWTLTVQHFRAATSGDIALHYGTPVQISRKLEYWTYWLGKSISPFPAVTILLAVIVIYAIIVSLYRKRRLRFRSAVEASVDNGTLLALTLAGMICATVLVFALQINEDTRFLVSTTPMVAILIGWALSILYVRVLSVVTAAALGFGGAVSHAHAFGFNPLGTIPYNWLLPIERSPSEKVLLTQATRATCRTGDEGRTSVIAVHYWWLNQNSAAFFSAKDALNGGRPCRYVNLASDNVDRALQEIATIAPRYVITIAPDKQLPLGTAKAPDFVNRISLSLAQRLGTDYQFELAPGSDGFLLIYQKHTDASKKQTWRRLGPHVSNETMFFPFLNADRKIAQLDLRICQERDNQADVMLWIERFYLSDSQFTSSPRIGICQGQDPLKSYGGRRNWPGRHLSSKFLRAPIPLSHHLNS
jgi:hypothetical protein